MQRTMLIRVVVRVSRSEMRFLTRFFIPIVVDSIPIVRPETASVFSVMGLSY